MFIGEYNRSVILTYVCVVFGLMSMHFAMVDKISYSMMCFIVCGVCDLFDGVVARRMKRTIEQEQFGVEIDSLCDMISFAAVPAVLILTQVNTFFLIRVTLSTIYVLAAIIRLAHFNCLSKQTEGGVTYFIGLPVTYGALLFPLSFYVTAIIAKNTHTVVWGVMAPLISLAFITNCKIPKPNKWMYIFFVVLAIMTLIGLGML